MTQQPTRGLNKSAHTTVFVDTISGIDKIVLNVDSRQNLGHVVNIINNLVPESIIKRTHLSFKGGSRIHENDLKMNLQQLSPEGILNLRMNACLCGGKGGFGTMLRSQGNRMSRKKRKDENMDSWKTLDGHKLRDIRKAKEMVKVLAENEREKGEALDRKKKKLQAILAGGKNKKEEMNVGDESASEFLEESENLVNDVRDSMRRSLGKKATNISTTTGETSVKMGSLESSKADDSKEGNKFAKSSKLVNYFDDSDEES